MTTATTTADTARWAMGGYAQAYPWAQCKYCGRAQNYDCPVVECLLCGTRQCNSRTDCGVCHYGWIPGWSRGYGADKECGYAGCAEPAIAEAPRIKRVCRNHIPRVKLSRRSLTEHIAEQTAKRDAGKGWERWRYVT